LILIMLCLLLAKRKKKKGEMAWDFFPRADMPCWLCYTIIF
jgi:hypothetical protein